MPSRDDHTSHRLLPQSVENDAHMPRQFSGGCVLRPKEHLRNMAAESAERREARELLYGPLRGARWRCKQRLTQRAKAAGRKDADMVSVQGGAVTAIKARPGDDVADVERCFGRLYVDPGFCARYGVAIDCADADTGRSKAPRDGRRALASLWVELLFRASVEQRQFRKWTRQPA